MRFSGKKKDNFLLKNRVLQKFPDFYTKYNTNMAPTTSTFNAQPRLSLDSGLGLTNDSFYSTDLNETHLMDISAGNASTSFQSQPPPQLESSPPTKWARIRTPPNRKKKISHEGPNQEALPPGFNLFSPPSRKKIKTAFSSPPPKSMKTPDSLRKSIRISSPSPFKVTFSKTPLKLSNNENVTGEFEWKLVENGLGKFFSKNRKNNSNFKNRKKNSFRF